MPQSGGAVFTFVCFHAVPLQDVAAGKAQYIHHYGDVSYATGYLQTWDEYLWMISPFASATPLAIGIGNHETLWVSFM